VIIGLLILIWSAGFVQCKHGGAILILLSIALLLFGGGIFPPLIGLVGGAAGTQINKPLTGKPGSLTQFAAKLWPWPLVIFIVWVMGQFPVGYFFNDLMKSIIGFGLILILTMLPLSVYAGYAHDAVSQSQQGGCNDTLGE
jgi:hypothetical protein